MRESPSAAPATPSVLQRLSAAPKASVREQVQRLTAEELNDLVDEMNGIDVMPTVFESHEAQSAIEKRMEELGIVFDAQEKWKELKESITTATDTAMERAEQTFVHKLMAKAGGWGILGAGLLSVLSWLGFGKAKELKESLATKGYLRTAIEGAKEHPIFASLIAALGLKVGSEAYAYVEQNRDTLVEYVEAVAGKTGRDAIEVVGDIAEKVKTVAIDAKDTGLRALVKGLAYATGGTYNEETGVVTLENMLFGGQKSLKPPFIIAWQAGVRRDGGTAMMKKAYSLFLIEDRFDAILRQADTARSHATEADAYLTLSAKRGQELLAAGVRPGANNAQSRELEQIMDMMLKADPVLQTAKPLDTATASPAELEERLKHVETEMQKHFAEEEAPRFKRTADKIKNDLAKAEESLASGKYKGSSKHLKDDVLKEVGKELADYDSVNERKIGLAKEQADLLNALDANTAMQQHAKHTLDTAPGGTTRTARVLDRSVETAHKTGSYLMRTKLGKWTVGAVTGYSFLPLALEGAAALQSGEEGAAAKKALTYDAGEAIGGFIPGVGEALDFRSAIMGTDLNGRELDTWQRVTAGAMGTLGTASIVAGFFTGGATIVGFRALRGAAAARKAGKIYKAAKNGIEVAGVTQKALKAVDKANDSTKALENMLEITTLQRRARRVQNVIHNAQRTMQLVTYGQLGLQLYSGVTTIYGNTEAVVHGALQKVSVGAEAVQKYIGGTPHA